MLRRQMDETRPPRAPPPPPLGGEPLRPHPALGRYYGSEGERRQRLARWFDGSAASYDRICQVMSFGSGHWYRRQALLRAGLEPGMSALDVACGTGVLAAHARELVGEHGSVLGLDPSTGMLLQARRRGVARLVRGVAEALPLAAGSFDFLSMGYALRHVPDLRVTFEEYRRALRPGGRLLILEITPPATQLRFRLLKLYLRRVVPLFARLGGGGRGSQELMEYYWDTVESCVPPPVILAALEQAGFAEVARRVELGIFSEYTARR
jgi:demethylmenaquinone methyltransferase / 2-methoxy-6-polyprenyl-1,4-benzoquinol methylase